MKILQDFNVQNKRVLVRVDFNVPLDEQGKVADDFRIKKSLPTIRYLKEQGAKIILISHLGRPEGRRDPKYTLKPVAVRVGELLGQKVKFLDDCIGEAVEQEIVKMKEGGVVLLENLRFYRGEQENSEEFAKVLAALADIYINDGFAVCHRAHASIVGVPQYLPAGAGLLLQEEIKTMSKIIEKPMRPLIVIIGGVKIAVKIDLIKKFLKEADHLLVGGMIANVILAAKGVCLDGAMPPSDIAQEVEEIELTNPKLHLPVDGLLALQNLQEDYVRQAAIGTMRREESAFDIGPETIEVFSQIIKEAKTIFWNGPLGYFEDERFTKGSLNIASAVIESRGFSVVGGGETIEFLGQHNLRKYFNYVSTGGGAMLDFLVGANLSGLEALNKMS